MSIAPDPDTILLVLRFLRYGAAMLLWGGGLYLALLASPGLAARISPRLARRSVVATVLLAAVIAVRLPLQAASFGEGWADAVRPEMLGAVLGTRAGAAWLADASLVLLLLAAAWLDRCRLILTTAIAGLLLASSALTGHATMGLGNLAIIHQFNDAVHLLAAGFWLGALPFLALTLRHEGAGMESVQAVERFGVIGQYAVALVLVTGVTNAILIKGGTPLRWSSLYDILLGLKLAVVFTMIGIAAVNHFRLLPRLKAGSNSGARTLRRGALLELALGAAAIGLVTVFGMLDAA
jgi:putative copper resistance protein D